MRALPVDFFRRIIYNPDEEFYQPVAVRKHRGKFHDPGIPVFLRCGWTGRDDRSVPPVAVSDPDFALRISPPRVK
jgi:hypothetical protein